MRGQTTGQEREWVRKKGGEVTRSYKGKGGQTGGRGVR